MKFPAPVTLLVFAASAWAQSTFYQPFQQVQQYLQLTDSQIQTLAEHVEDNHGVGSNAVNNPPSLVLVVDSKFVALRANRWHWPGMRQTKTLAFL